MSRRNAEAIVLRTRPVGEADLIVTFLTETEGKIEGSARSARRSRRRFGGALAPMTRGRFTWTETEERELVRLESIEITASFAARQADLAWFYLFAYLAEVADTFARDREPDPRVFRLVRAATDAAEQGVAPGTVRRWFEVWTLRLQGLLPDLEICGRCGTIPNRGEVVVEIETGETACADCSRETRAGGERARLSADELRWIRRALKEPIVRMTDPGRTPGLERMFRLLCRQFTGRPFRTARFLEATL